MTLKRLLVEIATIVLIIAVCFGVIIGVELIVKPSQKHPGSISYKAKVEDHIGSDEEIFECVDSTEEFNEIYGDYYKDTYNDAFFEENSIIVMHINSGSSLPQYLINNVYIEDNVLYLDIKAITGGQGAQALWTWRIFVEVKKSDIEGIVMIDKKITAVTRVAWS